MAQYLWIVALVVFIGAVVFLAIKERKNLKNWLLYAVAAAEKDLGSGTGELKLRQVYDSFLAKFPIASKFISFTAFKGLVNTALVELQDLIKSNQQVNTYVNKGE